jgi:hypothetical protein
MDAVLQPPVWQALSQSISNHQTKDRLISASSCITFMPTMPPIAQVSMPSNANPYAILESITTDGGLCKVMCDQQGYILGASICSEQAESVLGAIAMAMRGKVKISELPLISGYLADLHLPEQWQQWQ